MLPGGLPLLGHVPRLWRDPLGTLCSLTEVGRVVRVDLGTRPAYFLTDPTDVHDLLVKHGGITAKGRLFERARDFVGMGLTTSDGELHRRQRALLQPLFTRARVNSHAEIMSQAALHMMSDWEHGDQIELDQAMYGVTATVLTRAMFGSAATPAVIAAVNELLPQVADGLFARTLLPKAFTRAPVPANRRFNQAVTGLRALTDELIATGGGELLRALRAGAMSDAQLRDEVITIMMSGIETTAITFCWAFHEMAARPAITRRLHAEIDTAIGTRPIGAADVDRLPSAGRYLNEIMRLHAVPVIMRKAIAPLELAGQRFPKGAEICYSPYGLHRDPRLFAEPLSLDPERWTAPVAPAAKDAFTPFGAGRRRCIGHTFAWAELLIVLATIATRWRLEPVGPPPRASISTSIPRPDALPMRLTRRRTP